MRKSYRRAALLVAALHGRRGLAGQGQKSGSPEDHLPPNITQLTGFGERASWSPDGTRHRVHVEELRRRVRGRRRDEGDPAADALSERRATCACSTCRTATTS